MGHTAINRYKADLRELDFVLFEQFGLADLLGQEPFADWGVEEVRATLQEVYRFSQEVTGPLNAVGDAQGCRLVEGQVRTPDGFKEAWEKLYAAGLKLLKAPVEHGGTGAPASLAAIANELASGSNTAFDMYPGLTLGAADLIEEFGTPEQKARYCGNMFTGVWAGTMCLTEPAAGSDVGAAATTATPNGDGTYTISGTKLFISGGDQDITENIVHMVLARTPGAPKGTKGLSLFIVPKRRVNADGSSGEPNDVKCIGLEHKMGINGSATAMLQFGEDGGCRGELCGTVERQGMRQMFQMMNYARIGVALQGLGIASAAYLSALEYARERKQGSSIENFKDPESPRVPILEHPGVRRMLLDMKSRVEGMRAIVVKLTLHLDRATALQGKDDDAAAYHQGQVELLTPIAKSYASDQAFRVSELAIQVHGGVGYTRDYPVEQHARDAKIFSIYEGTNGIQALDLVGRKLSQRGGKNAQDFLGDIQRFVDGHRAHPTLGAQVAKLALAQEAVASCAMQFMAWAGGGELVRIPLASDRFLALMSDLTVGWLLLDAASIAEKRLLELPADHPDRAFYLGKRHAAVFFAENTLSLVPAGAQSVLAGDRSPLEIADASFAGV
ncbi:MAG: acyl-CoA dehydrogenase [Polyangiaceae bacterium]|nr:acyl-CoA dehydrogenase [Polyangiaceae bacterium]